MASKKRKKVVSISRKADKTKPLISMTERQLDETFMELGSGLDEGLLEDARIGREQEVNVTTVLLRARDGSEKVFFMFEEYGDGSYVDLCEDIIKEHQSFLQRGESLRTANFTVDMNKLVPVDFPTLAVLEADNNEGRRRFSALQETRGEEVLTVVWLKTATSRTIASWNLDHGDGSGMYEHTSPFVRSAKYNQLLEEGEDLEVAAYSMPSAALIETPRPWERPSESSAAMH